MRFVRNLRFVCVNDSVPPQTTRSLKEACATRGIEYVEIDARSFDYAPEKQLSRGDMMYRPAISLVAMRVEQFLWNQGVATFYAQPDGVFFAAITPPLRFERAGLPIPRTVYCSTTNRAMIQKYVERVGGLPLIVKILGHSRGVGVIRVDSLPALYSLLDYELSQGANPLLAQYIDDATHWRLLVLGDRVIASYRNAPMPNDFRPHVAEGKTQFDVAPSEAMQDVAVRAVNSMRLEFGGVDFLEQADGKFYLLETNFPCYYYHAQEFGGIDVAGLMVDFLAAKAKEFEK